MSDEKRNDRVGFAGGRYDDAPLTERDPAEMAAAMERWAARLPAEDPEESTQAWLTRLQRHMLGAKTSNVTSFADYVRAKRAQSRPGVEIRRKQLDHGIKFAAKAKGSEPLPAPYRTKEDSVEVSFAEDGTDIVVTLQVPGGVHGSLDRYKGRNDLVIVFGDARYEGEELKNCYAEINISEHGMAQARLPDVPQVRALLTEVSIMRLAEVDG